MTAGPVIGVVGPTAAGKSDLALDLAERLGGEVINTDSMQVYPGMDIGTAKIPVGQRRGIPHHLLDFLDIDQTASVAAFQRLARAVIEDCHGRAVVPIVVGGSALYTRGVLDEIDFPGTDPAIRARLEQELADHGTPALYERLRQVDPGAAASIEPANSRRIVRALEVIELTGGGFKATMPELKYHYPRTIQIGVRMPRLALDQRIEARVHQMWAQGFVDEVRGLEPRLRGARTASRAIGYAQVLAFLAGEISEAEAQRQTIVATRRFVRRQDAWFLKDPRIHWVDALAGDAVDQALTAIEKVTAASQDRQQ